MGREGRVAELLEQLETPGLDPALTDQIVDEINSLRHPPEHPGTVPRSIAKPHRPVALTTKQRAELPPGIAPRAAFLPGVTQELPPQDLEADRAQVEADIARRVETLEQILEDPNLAEITRQTIMAEITRLTQGG